MHNLGLAQAKLGQFEVGEVSYRGLIPLCEKPATSLGARSNLDWALNKEARYMEAEAVLRGLLPDLKERFAEDDLRVLGCSRHSMEAVGGQGRIDEALKMDVVTKMLGEYDVAELEAMKEIGALIQGWKNKA